MNNQVEENDNSEKQKQNKKQNKKTPDNPNSKPVGKKKWELIID